MLRNADPSRPKTIKPKKPKKPDPVFESLGIKQEDAPEPTPRNLLYLFIIPLLLALILIFFCCSCTFSITSVHTQGKGDVVDEEQTSEPDISPNFQIPKTLTLPSFLNG